MESIKCGNQYFTIPCNREGATSTLLLRFQAARVRQTCEVSCGATNTTFEITGILQWTRTIHGSAMRIINGESNVYDEIVLPDFLHIADVMLSWYKTIILVALGFILALVIGYLFLWTCGIKLLRGAGRIFFGVLCTFVRIARWTLKKVSTLVFRRCSRNQYPKKQL
ncbi:hypothetical protein GCK32_015164 [Trichostrongylus colubriformis]|uniref:Phlebovirus glycoprotein G2 fusion domain-containing protein n=1 Tax=Trichostrongylus colubriformis TaxID=6319 RepID=A0AAN8F0C4_TRICO